MPKNPQVTNKPHPPKLAKTELIELANFLYSRYEQKRKPVAQARKPKVNEL
jgi:hypothetical protein